MCYDVTSKNIYSGAGDGMIVCWKMDEQDGQLVIRHHQAVYTLALDNTCLYSGTRSGLLSAFYLSDYSLKKHLQLSEAPLFEILTLNDGVAVVAGDGCLYVLDQDCTLTHKVQLSDKPLRTIITVPEGFAIGASDGRIYVLNHQFELIDMWQAQSGSVFTMCYDKQHETLICGGRDAVLKWFNGHACMREVKAHLLHVHRLQMREDGKYLLSSSMDKTIKLWEAGSGDLLKVINAEKNGAHTSSVNKILWIDKNTIISCSDDRTLKCFEIQEK